MTLETKPFTVCTFNGHDNASPPRGATFLGLQERDRLKDLEALERDGLTLWAPPGLQEAIAWDPQRFTLEAKGREFLHGDGRSYGHPLTTPSRWALWIAGTLDGVHRTAVICTHLINNAWGAAIRGERRLRRRLWRKGWSIVLRLRKRLERKGYAVFLVGDLNRADRYWHGHTTRILGRGFDRILWPEAVEDLEAWTGDANGSDHLPLFGRFRWRGRHA